MSQNPNQGIFIANNTGRLIRLEVGGRDADGKFTDEGFVELADGEFQMVEVPKNGSVQAFIKDD